MKAPSSVQGSPKNTDDISQFVIELVCRLRAFFAFVVQSLNSEYLYRSKTIEDWRRMLEWIENSFFPVCQLYGRLETSPFEFMRNAADRIEYFQLELARSRQLLRDKAGSPIRILFALRMTIGNIVSGLEIWIRELTANSTVRSTDWVGVRKNTLGLFCHSARSSLLQTMADLHRQLQLGDETEICMLSRRLFLLNYYTAAVRPDEWTREIYDEVVRLHVDAVEMMRPGPAQHSTQKRLDKLKQYNAVGFNDFVRELAA